MYQVARSESMVENKLLLDGGFSDLKATQQFTST